MHGNVSIKDDIISVGRPLPRLASVDVVTVHTIRIRFTSGVTRLVDLGPVLRSRAVFKTIHDDEQLFRQVAVNADGNALEWPDGAELSAVWLAELPAVDA